MQNPSDSFYLYYLFSADTSVGLFVNKTLNPSSYSVIFLTEKYIYRCLKSSAQVTKDVMIYNVYRTRNLSPTSSENQAPMGSSLLIVLSFLAFFFSLNWSFCPLWTAWWHQHWPPHLVRSLCMAWSFILAAVFNLWNVWLLTFVTPRDHPI